MYFPKPSWQSGPGVPADGFRDVPDVAFPASPAHDNVYVYSGGGGAYYGGTSVAAPVFAGMVALLNHYLVSTGIEKQAGLGNINPALYRLAANTSGLFHDVATGDNSVPCVQGSPNCSNGSLGYGAVSGYDRATGLGSVDLTNLAHQWSSKPPIDSAVVPSVDQNPVYQQPAASGTQPWTYQITLTEEGGVATTLTDFTINGQSQASQISSIFGTAVIPAGGSIKSSGLGFSTLTVPTTVVFGFSGIDASGRTWSTQLSVPFQAAQPAQLVLGLSNAASGQQVFAPGMIMSVYGIQMGLYPALATAIPLPDFLAGITAEVNGISAPLYYVSPTQLNIQIPYETQTGTATLEVDTPYQNVTRTFHVAQAGPGIFTLPDGSVNPSRSGSRGQTYTMFITGEGHVSPSITTGSAPTPRTGTPKPVLPYTLTIGGVDATASIQYIGVPPGLVGVTQINFTVPQAAPVGPQNIVVTVGGVASAPATFTVQ